MRPPGRRRPRRTRPGPGCATATGPSPAAPSRSRPRPSSCARRRPATARPGDAAWRAAPPGPHRRPAHHTTPPPRATHHRVSARGGHRARRGWTRGSFPDSWPDSGRPRCAFVPELLILPDRPDRTVVEAPSWLLRSSATDAACLRRPSVVVVEPAQHREGHDAPAGLYAARPLPLVRDPLPDPLVRSPPVEVSHPFGEHAA